MATSDRKVTITFDFIPKHEYEFVVRAIGEDGTNQAIESSVRQSITIAGKLAVPDTPTTLTAAGFLNSVSLVWTNPLDFDFKWMEIWRSSADNVDTSSKIAEVKGITYIDPIGSADTTRYYWIRAVNTSNKKSDWYPRTTAGVEATTLGIEATDIDDFAVTATKRFDNTVILTGDVWTDADPVTWNKHNLVYGGAYYEVAAGNTTDRFITWTVGNTGGAGTVDDPYLTTYSGDAAYTSANNKFNIAVNESNVVQLVWNSSANMVIGSAFILNAAIIEAKIDNLAVTDAKIHTMTANKLTAGTIDASVITVTNLDAAEITTGILTARHIRTAAAGARVEMFRSAAVGFSLNDGAADTFVLYIAAAVAGDMQVGNYPAGKHMYWDQSAGSLTIRGTLNADDLVAGTITARTLQTAASGQRIVINEADNNFKLFIGAGAGTVKVTIDDDIVPGVPGIKVDDGVVQVYKDATTFTVMTTAQIGAFGDVAGDTVIQGWRNVSASGDEGVIEAYQKVATTGNLFRARVGALEVFKVDDVGDMEIYGEFIANSQFTSGKQKLTAIGGYAIKLENRTGVNTVAGTLVEAASGNDDAFALSGVDEKEVIGIVLDSGVNNGSDAWIVISGIADVAMKDNTTATRGNWVKTSDEVGYADATNATPPGGGIPELGQHMQEIGNCIESVAATGGGTHVLARCVLHFN